MSRYGGKISVYAWGKENVWRQSFSVQLKERKRYGGKAAVYNLRQGKGMEAKLQCTTWGKEKVWRQSFSIQLGERKRYGGKVLIVQQTTYRDWEAWCDFSNITEPVTSLPPKLSFLEERKTMFWTKMASCELVLVFGWLTQFAKAIVFANGVWLFEEKKDLKIRTLNAPKREKVSHLSCLEKGIKYLPCFLLEMEQITIE